MGQASGVSFFPAFLDLRGRRVLVVGGGKVATAKVEALHAAGAETAVVSPAVEPRIHACATVVHQRRFQPDDLDGAWFVVAAATEPVNAEVAEAAKRRRLFVNVADDPSRATAYLGGVVRRGGVTVAVSTDGLAPALAALLREALEAVLPEELGLWLETARLERQLWKASATAIPRRRPLLLAALNRLYAAREATS